MHNPLRLRAATALASVATLGLAVWMLTRFPLSAPLHGGWKSPIIAFELAQTPADLQFLFGADGANIREAMNAGHQIDNFFPLAYGTWLALMVLHFRGRLVWFGALAALATIPLDLWENHILTGLIAAIENNQSVEPGLSQLWYATWSKWGSLGCALAVLGWYRWPKERVVPVLCGMSALSIAATMVSGAPPLLGEAMSSLVSITFLNLMLRAIKAAIPSRT